jgi:2-polyprenyl-3-methyl-5-hydroxy-6-metoxy-1,4-benzoquinol methylase
MKISFKTRIHQEELLDDLSVPFADIAINMKELDTINTLLGGHAITIKGIEKLIENKTNLTVCEVGCGGGDNLKAIYNWARKKNISLQLAGLDYNKNCIQYAKQTQSFPCEWIEENFLTHTKQYDIIFCSLFTHHFKTEQLKNILLQMKSQSKIGIIINDLHRHPIAFYSIKFLTKVFSKSYLVKNDAPLSVLNGFVIKEWKEIFSSLQMKASIQWKWAFRHLILYKHD